MEALIGQLLTYGTTPALLVLTAAVGFLIKRSNTNSKKDAARADSLQKFIQVHIEKTDIRFREHAERMAAFERDYLPIETHYKDIGGWRSDIAQLRSDVAEDLRGIRAEMSATNTNLLATVLKEAKS